MPTSKKKTKKELLAEPCHYHITWYGSMAHFDCQHKQGHRGIIAMPGRIEAVREGILAAGYTIDPIELTA